MADHEESKDFPSKGDVRENIEFLKSCLGGILSTCELDKLEDDLCNALNVNRNCIPRVNSDQINRENTLTNIGAVVLILRHIYKSKNYLLLDHKQDENFSLRLSSFVDEATKGKKVFSLVDFLEGVANYCVDEVKSLDALLEKSSKKIKEASECNLKEKACLCSHVYFTICCVLSSNAVACLVRETGVMPLKDCISNIVKGITMVSRFPQHEEFNDICLLEDNSMHYFHKVAFECLKSINFIFQWMSNELKKTTQGVEVNTLFASFMKFLLKSCVDELTFVVLQHIGRHSWTSTETRVEAQNLLSFLLKLTHSANVEALLVGSENIKAITEAISEHQPTPIFPNGIIKLLLENICSKFFSNGWKRDPSLIHVVAHVIRNIKFPNLKPHISVFVPLLLEIIGDYRSENQILGIECLAYLIENVTASDLNLYNHAELIYKSLFKLLYGTKPSTLKVLLPCLQKILYALEPFPDRLESSRSSKWDEILQKLISNLEYESTSEAREILASNLSGFINAMGINCARFLLSIMKATSFCLEMYDNKEGRIRKEALNIIKSIIVTCWPIMWRHIGTIMKTIMKVVIDISMEGTVIEEEACVTIKEKTKEIIILLSKCCGPDLVLDYLDHAVNAKIGDCFCGLKEFLMDTKRTIVLDES